MVETKVKSSAPPPPSALKNFIAGGAGGVSLVITGQPLDTIKVCTTGGVHLSDVSKEISTLLWTLFSSFLSDKWDVGLLPVRRLSYNFFKTHEEKYIFIFFICWYINFTACTELTTLNFCIFGEK